MDVGLDYLSLDRSADTLSGGEAQRIRLASQIGSGLVGVMYILDEPSIGLHQRDNQRLLDTLVRLRDLGNTVIVVEHDEDAIRQADHVVDLGPGAGVHGGRGRRRRARPRRSRRRRLADRPVPLAAGAASRCRRVRTPAQRGARCASSGRRGNNLQDVTVEFPLGLLTCVTGVSGSGKSHAGHRHALPALRAALHGASASRLAPRRVEGLEQIDRVIDIDQSPIGRTPRSNPATYTGLFGPIRELFAQLPEARTRGYEPGAFQLQRARAAAARPARATACSKVEMHFLPDVYVPCDVCRGKRYNRETLEVRYKGRNIHEVLEMTVEEARGVLPQLPARRSAACRRCSTWACPTCSLGQNATTLSGGEAQRVKLARELAKRAHRPHALHPRRADHRPALPRHRASCSPCCTACATRATRSS